MPADDGAGQGAAPAQAAIVRTILRDMSPDELSHGATLFHEHMSMNNQFWLDMGLERLVDTSRPYFMEDLDYMVAEMQAAAEDGIACIVDGGHADMGRDVEFLRALSEQSGMPIVASGGYYHEPTFPPDLYERSEDDLVEEFPARRRTAALGRVRRDRLFGREHGGPSARCCRPSGAPTWRRACRSSRTRPTGAEAVAQLDLLESLGVDPAHVVIGHLGYPEVTVHAEICGRGAYVGFDRLGGAPEADAAQVPMILALLEAGHADRVLLASDLRARAGHARQRRSRLRQDADPLRAAAARRRRRRRRPARHHQRQPAALPGVRAARGVSRVIR